MFPNKLFPIGNYEMKQKRDTPYNNIGKESSIGPE